MEKNTILIQKVSEIMRDKFKLDPEKLSPEANLREDLDLDSIDLFDLVAVIEKDLNVLIDTAEFGGVQTVAQLISKLESSLIEEDGKADSCQNCK